MSYFTMKETMHIFKKLLLLLCIAFQQLESAHIIFDLGNVLIKTDYVQSCKLLSNLSIKDLVLHLVTGHSPFKLRQKWLTFLADIQPANGTTYTLYDEHGNPLPALMIDWLTGARPTTEIRECIATQLATHDQQLTSFEQSFFKAITAMIFTPENFIKTRKIIPSGVAFAQACKNKGDKLYILSNWDAESYELMTKLPEYQKLFALFDDIVISGSVNLAKPDQRIYEHILIRFKLDPRETVFIDDQQKNCAAATAVGIHAIHCPYHRTTTSPLFAQPDFSVVSAELAAWKKLN